LENYWNKAFRFLFKIRGAKNTLVYANEKNENIISLEEYINEEIFEIGVGHIEEFLVQIEKDRKLKKLRSGEFLNLFVKF
jgi:hypothetical protein